MDQKHMVSGWVWMGTCTLAVGACVIEGEYLPDDPLPVSIMGAATRAPICGDGIRAASEACDDFNTQSGDGCSHDCVVEVCFTCSDDPAVARSICGPACDEHAGQYCYEGTCVSCADNIKNG